MDTMTTWPGDAAEPQGIRFTGTWREYLPIAATNVLLIVVTLGIYRFWAAARQRRYLWSRTRFIDDHFEWTGTGKEMLIGFLIVMAALLPFFLFIQFLFPALIARGYNSAAILLLIAFYASIVFLGGIARFRALRYRLSRSWWHGIRGGSDDPGLRFGAQYLLRQAISAFTLFILFPWSATSLWNMRWNAMSFGPLRFRATLDTEGLRLRWALLYLMPIALIVAAGAAGATVALLAPGQTPNPTVFVVLGLLFVVAYLAIPLATLAWFAKFYRLAAANLGLGDLSFGFDARTRQWLGLFLGNIALAVVTLGFGIAFWGYRNWAFMVRHLQVYGEVDLATLSQSTTRAPGEAEGFADAFDIGAL